MEFYDDPWSEGRGTIRKGYDAAQVCLNGHLITTFVHTQPEHNKRFCNQCGAETTFQCRKCKTEIQGHYYQPGITDLTGPGPPPAYCQNCGSPYPWTERRLVAARELADSAESLDEDEKRALKDSVEDLVQNKASTPNSIIKYKKLAAKAGRQVADGLRQVLVDVLSEAIKKQIWP